MATVAACGSIDDVHQRPVLASLNGRVNVGAIGAGPADPTSLRVAIVWASPENNLAGERFSSDMAVEAAFPASFSMALATPPPAGSMLSKARAAPGPSGSTDKFDYATWPDEAALALGQVIAYEDRNHNGKLDLVEDDASSFVDRVLGSSENMFVLYIEGAVPPELRTAPDGSRVQVGYGQIVKGGYRSISTAFDLLLNGSERMQRYMCQGQVGLDLDHGLPGGADKKTYVPTPPGLVTYLPARLASSAPTAEDPTTSVTAYLPLACAGR